MKIQKEISIYELLKLFPESVSFLMEKGIKCIACGEPVWGTLEEAAREKNFEAEEIEKIVEELNTLYSGFKGKQK
jgi:methionine synthase II (cobalamin-independent)